MALSLLLRGRAFPFSRSFDPQKDRENSDPIMPRKKIKDYSK